MAETEWERYRVHILAEIERFNDTARSIDSKVDDLHRTVIPEIKTRIALLELRAAMVGAGAGLGVSALLGLLTRLFP